MLPVIDTQEKFRYDPAVFRVEETGDKDVVFLVHSETGGRVQTDSVGKSVLEMLPGSLADLSKKINANGHRHVSPRMLKFYLMLFWKAGIIAKEKEDINQKEDDRDLSSAGPKTDKRVSVIIVTFNGETFIGNNLETLSRQTLAPGEIIIVDNVSTDGSLDMVEKKYPAVKIIRNKKNYHYARAVNIGVEAAEGELVVILNQDLEMDERFIENLVRRYDQEENKEKVAGVVPQMRFMKLRGFINGIGNFITEKDWGSDNYFCALDIGQFDRLKYVGSACFGAIMVTKNGWAAVGPLDKKYKSYYEDADWSIRAHMAGMNILAAPDSVVYHAFGGSYPSGLKLTFIAKNRMRFVLKNLKGKLLKTFFKKYLKHDIKSSLSFIRNRQFKNIYYYTKAYLRLLREFPGLKISKWRTHHTPEKDIRPFFTKGAPYVVLSNRSLDPVIDRHTIRAYYFYTEMEEFRYPTEIIKVY